MDPKTQALVTQLNLQPHPEGGYFVETDRQEEVVGSPFAGGETRSLATSIYYLLTRDNPNGVIHMNKSVTYHVLHSGRAEYTLITPPKGEGSKATVERKVMGTDVSKGETRLLLVGSGIWKMSRLLPDAASNGHAQGQTTSQDQEKQENDHCLITEVVVPGFHWEDHQFLVREELEALFAGQAEEGKQWVKELGVYLK